MILIRPDNLYRMLAYAFPFLNRWEYGKIARTGDPPKTALDLLAAVLSRGIQTQLRRGLHRDYREMHGELATVRGKVDVAATIKANGMQRGTLTCTYDEFTEDAYCNRILKTTAALLLRSHGVDKERKKDLRGLLRYFSGVCELRPDTITWQIQYTRATRPYAPLMELCRIILQGLMLTKADGSLRVASQLEEGALHTLYEKFILAYYQKHFGATLTARAQEIKWCLDDGYEAYLPRMKTDITLTRGEDMLIIDAKYYGRTMREEYHTLHSANLYQIFTYVKNRATEAARTGKVGFTAGMLLYAATDEAVLPHNTYRMSNNRIDVMTLPLNADFDEICHRLNAIAEDHFGVLPDA